VGWEGQLSQLRDLLVNDPESGMESVRRWFGVNDPERNPEYPDPIPNESTVIAQAIMAQPIDPNDPPRKLSDEERERLADEIEMDML
jgi:hypothetical protein